MMTSEEIVHDGSAIILPTLDVVKNVPIMSANSSIDWLLHISYTRRDFERCKRFIERELQNHLNPEYLYFIKALIDREEGRNIEALRNLQKALELNSKNIETYKEMGKTLYKMGRYNQSLGVFREAEELSPRLDHEIYHFIGELLLRSASSRNQSEMMQQEQSEAKQYLQKAVQSGKKLESFQRLAELYRKEHDHHKAVEVLESCLLLYPENTEVLTDIAVLYLKLNESQRAYDRLLEVVQYDNTWLRGLMAYAAVLQSRNDIDAALGRYKEIAAVQPHIPELWNNIGLCFYKKKKFILAISSLRKAVWLSPLNYNALYNLSLMYISAKQYASAFHTLAAAINLRKDNADCYMLLGICLCKLDDFENAFAAFERANALEMATATATATNSTTPIAAKEPTRYGNPLIHLNFALFCYGTRRFNLAIEQYQIYSELAQNLKPIPTEYKFQATKLKSMLNISSSDLLVNAATLAKEEPETLSNPNNGSRQDNTNNKEYGDNNIRIFEESLTDELSMTGEQL